MRGCILALGLMTAERSGERKLNTGMLDKLGLGGGGLHGALVRLPKASMGKLDKLGLVILCMGEVRNESPF